MSAIGFYFYKEYVLAVKTLDRQPLSECGYLLPQESIPATLIAGILAQEDHLFFYHKGFNWNEVEVSIRKNFQHKKIMRGASTIDMQVASICYLSNVKSRWIRKLKEILLTKLINDRYNKAEIMRAYLTAAPLIPDSKQGGFEAASLYYFQKSINELNLDEERALILALRNKQTLNPEALKKRNNLSKYYEISVETAQNKLPLILNHYKDSIMKNLNYTYFNDLEIDQTDISADDEPKYQFL